MSDWRWSHDPADPCSLCVHWEEREDDPMGDEARPVWPDGSTVPLVFNRIHTECNDAAMAYSMEAEA